MLCDSVPDGIDAVTISEPLEDAVATDHDEVEVVLYFEALDVGLAHYNVRIAAVAWPLRLDVAERLRHREAPREDAQRALHVKILLARMSGCLGESLRAIDLTARCLDSNLFQLVIRLVITAEHANLLATVDRHDGSRVSDVDDVDHLVDNHDDGSARARALRTDSLPGHEVLSSSLRLLNQRQEVSLTFTESLSDGLDRVLRELIVLHDEIVQVVSEVVSAR